MTASEAGPGQSPDPKSKPDNFATLATIVVGVLTFLGILIQNWDKISPASRVAEPTRTAPTTSIAPDNHSIAPAGAASRGPKRTAPAGDGAPAVRGEGPRQPSAVPASRSSDPPPVPSAAAAETTPAALRTSESKPPEPPPAVVKISVCDGTPALYRAEATVRHAVGERPFNVVLKLTNLSERQLIVFGAREPELYGKLFDDTQANVYDVYAGSTTAFRPPGNTPEETAIAFARRAEGGTRLDPRQTTMLTYTPMAKLGQVWRQPTRFTFNVGIWLVLPNAEQTAFEGRGDSLSCEIPAR